MAGRRIRDEVDARRCLTLADESGLGRAAWAHKEGIDARSLNAWRLKLERRPEPPPMVELVAAGSAAGRYVVRCGRMEVEVGDGFDQNTLLRLLQVVSAC